MYEDLPWLEFAGEVYLIKSTFQVASHEALRAWVQSLIRR